MHDPWRYHNLNCELMDEYGFTTDHVLVLEYLMGLYPVATPHRKHPEYRWFSLGGYLEQRKWHKLCLRQLQRVVADLCGEGVNSNPDLEYPIKRIKDYMKGQAGAKSYIAIHIPGMRKFCVYDPVGAGKPDAEENEPDTQTKGAVVRFDGFQAQEVKPRVRKSKPTKDILPRTRELLYEGKETEYSKSDEILIDGELFSHRLSTPGEPASKTLIAIEEKLIALVAGTFEENYELDDTHRERIDASWFEDFKVGWERTRELLFTAKDAYLSWKKSNPQLRFSKSFSDFLYNPVTKKSLLLTCLSGGHDASGRMAQTFIKKMDPRTVEIAHRFKSCRLSWNPYAYWKGLYSVYQYLASKWYDIIRENPTWHYDHISILMENYLIFLEDYAGANPNYLYYGSRTWDAFVEALWGDKEIDLDPKEIREKRA